MTTKSLLHSSLLDNQYYTSMLVGNTAYDPPFTETGYELLDSYELTGNTESVTFSNIASTYSADYDHLQFRLALQTNRSGGGGDIRMRINSNSGNSYQYHYLRGYDSTIASGNELYNSFYLGAAPGVDYPNRISGLIVDLNDPFDATKYKTVRAISGSTLQSNLVGLYSGVFMNSAAVATVQFFLRPPTPIFFTGKSRISLYGYRKS